MDNILHQVLHNHHHLFSSAGLHTYLIWIRYKTWKNGKGCNPLWHTWIKIMILVFSLNSMRRASMKQILKTAHLPLSPFWHYRRPIRFSKLVALEGHRSLPLFRPTALHQEPWSAGQSMAFWRQTSPSQSAALQCHIMRRWAGASQTPSFARIGVVNALI